MTASDVAPDFIDATKNQGVNTIKFNVLEDDFPDKYYAIFCWRVFVHFTKDDVLKVLNKTYDALQEGGKFIFNVINRELKEVDNEWVDFNNEYKMGVERFYSYFKDSDINELISKTNYKVDSFHKEGGKTGDKWLVYVLKK